MNAVFRRQRVMSHNPDVMICTIDHESNNELLYFGISRKNPKDKTDKKFGREVAEKRAKKAKKTGEYWSEGDIPLSGIVNKSNIRNLLIQFHRGNFRRS